MIVLPTSKWAGTESPPAGCPTRPSPVFTIRFAQVGERHFQLGPVYSGRRAAFTDERDRENSTGVVSFVDLFGNFGRGIRYSAIPHLAIGLRAYEAMGLNVFVFLPEALPFSQAWLDAPSSLLQGFLVLVPHMHGRLKQ